MASTDPQVGTDVVVGSRATGGLRVMRAQVRDYLAGGPNDPPTVMRLDMIAIPGDSGAPVVDTSGRLVGLIYASQFGSRSALVIPVSQIRAARGARVTPTCRP